jgi:hypothetical protein
VQHQQKTQCQQKQQRGASAATQLRLQGSWRAISRLCDTWIVVAAIVEGSMAELSQQQLSFDQVCPKPAPVARRGCECSYLFELKKIRACGCCSRCGFAGF